MTETLELFHVQVDRELVAVHDDVVVITLTRGMLADFEATIAALRMGLIQDRAARPLGRG